MALCKDLFFTCLPFLFIYLFILFYFILFFYLSPSVNMKINMSSFLLGTDFFSLRVQAAAAPAAVPLCCAHVPEGVCGAPGGHAGGQTVLPLDGEHTAARQGGSPHESGKKQLPAATQG